MSTTQQPRKQIPRDDFFKTFASAYNQTESVAHKELDTIPPLMSAEMNKRSPLMHLFSTYVVRPNQFDRDPYQIPKAYQHGPQPNAKQQYAKQP